MKESQRKILLGIALLVTLGLTAYVSRFDEDHQNAMGTITPTLAKKLSLKQQVSRETEIQSDQYFTRQMTEPKQDIFKSVKVEEVKKVDVPQPSKAAVVKPVAFVPAVVVPITPTAPPLPFKYIGKYADQSGLVVFLSLDGKNIIVKAGDIIQQNYRVDEIKPPVMTMTYLPMDMRQTINIGDIN